MPDILSEETTGDLWEFSNSNWRQKIMREITKDNFTILVSDTSPEYDPEGHLEGTPSAGSLWTEASPEPTVWPSWKVPEIPEIKFDLEDPIVKTATGDTSTSTAIFEVTSSNPWRLIYTRACSANAEDYLQARFTGGPGQPSHLGLTNILIDKVSGVDAATLTPFTSSIYQAGEYRINFEYKKKSNETTKHTVDRAAIGEVRIVGWGNNSTYRPIVSGSRYGCNNYPSYHAIATTTNEVPSANRADVGMDGTNVHPSVGSTSHYSSYNFGLATVIRGWKYGLYSGLPTHSKAVFRRNHYGHLRDMLEQRPFAMYIHEKTNSLSNVATPATLSTHNFKRMHDVSADKLISSTTKNESTTFSPTGPIEINFVKMRFSGNANSDSKSGNIYFEKVKPENTLSHNLSVYATSSLPYKDGIATMRTEENYTHAQKNSVISLISSDMMGNIII